MDLQFVEFPIPAQIGFTDIKKKKSCKKLFGTFLVLIGKTFLDFWKYFRTYRIYRKYC